MSRFPYRGKMTGNVGLVLSVEMASSLYLESTSAGAFTSGLG